MIGEAEALVLLADTLARSGPVGAPHVVRFASLGFGLSSLAEEVDVVLLESAVDYAREVAEAGVTPEGVATGDGAGGGAGVRPGPRVAVGVGDPGPSLAQPARRLRNRVSQRTRRWFRRIDI